ncbi:MAG: hypothetical protein NWT08_14410 [Akkermansiaceae bacterium]|nr:hypothetical protein [Akkermansiaceae bacterium]MDP4646702.1 hypothetical protein [Akkermansiaceae bacterium]MDP4721088.1 hypothetical protein [Akkermansiaceae bacterium]MDP4779618.1 hypothetical protein [Akkermansiaceae bacterium]MDP4846302.1 hypothetical protein [Akkermansiaceae bacterium]
MFLNLASIEAVRPVFMIVMGVFLMVVAWRIARETHGWSARLTFGGAFLLCLGYAILVPMYEAGKIEKFHPSLHLHNPAAAMGWHAVKLVVMNVGWLLFGLGVGLHSGLLRMPAVFKISKIEPLPSHEPVA